MTQEPKTASPWETYDWENLDLETAPLDAPRGASSIDWGGDGSDLDRPVRKHVLAALIPTTEPYTPPVDALLSLGMMEDEDTDAPELFKRFGLGQEHIHDLVRMARDRALHTATADKPEVMAPGYALDALSQLDMTAVIDDLIPLFDVDIEWFTDDFYDALADAHAVSFQPLLRYATDATRWSYGRAKVLGVLERIVGRAPALRSQVVASVSETLQHAETNTVNLNSTVVDVLLTLEAAEALPLIRHAFETGQVDETVHGDWKSVLKDFGQEPDPDDPLVEESSRRLKQKQQSLFSSDLQEQFQTLFGGMLQAGDDDDEDDDDDEEDDHAEVEPPFAFPASSPASAAAHSAGHMPYQIPKTPMQGTPKPNEAPTHAPTPTKKVDKNKAKQKRKQASATRKANVKKNKKKRK